MRIHGVKKLACSALLTPLTVIVLQAQVFIKDSAELPTSDTLIKKAGALNFIAMG